MATGRSAWHQGKVGMATGEGWHDNEEILAWQQGGKVGMAMEEGWHGNGGRLAWQWGKISMALSIDDAQLGWHGNVPLLC